MNCYCVRKLCIYELHTKTSVQINPWLVLILILIVIGIWHCHYYYTTNRIFLNYYYYHFFDSITISFIVSFWFVYHSYCWNRIIPFYRFCAHKFIMVKNNKWNWIEQHEIMNKCEYDGFRITYATTECSSRRSSALVSVKLLIKIIENGFYRAIQSI